MLATERRMSTKILVTSVTNNLVLANSYNSNY